MLVNKRKGNVGFESDKETFYQVAKSKVMETLYLFLLAYKPTTLFG